MSADAVAYGSCQNDGEPTRAAVHPQLDGAYCDSFRDPVVIATYQHNM